MADTYWVSFMIADNATYAKRYAALVAAVHRVTAVKHWEQTTSFIVFASDLTTAQLTTEVAQVIDRQRDTVLLGKFGYQTLVVIGTNYDDDIYELVPFAKKA